MSRILISFLGPGPLEKASSKEDSLHTSRVYRKADYHLANGDADIPLGKYSFVSAALSQYYHTDKILLIGTPHSMWEEVYSYFGGQDDNSYLEIADYCNKAKYDTPIENSIPHLAQIEELLGKGSKVILIKYGITPQEIKENIDTILGLEQYLSTGDELIVDITHSFRSLPIFIMNLLIYLQNVSGKGVTISHIHYGMLDIVNELGYARIVDLKEILTVNEWISGAYSFSEFANGYKIAELLEEEENKSAAMRIRRFSDLLNLNHLSAIQNEAQGLTGIQYNSKISQMSVKPIVDKFKHTFGKNDNPSHFQLKMARWHFSNRKYALSYLTLLEAIVTYKCMKEELDWENYDDRENAKEMIKKDPILSHIYYNIRKVRNCTAHAIRSNVNYKQMIEQLSQALKELEEIIK